MDEIKSKKSKAKLTTLLNDLKSAFDSVPHEKLFHNKMPQFGFNEELINTIEWLYT